MKIKLLCIIVVFFMIAGGNTSVLAQNKVKSTNEADDKKNDIIHITDHKSFEVTFNDDQFYGWLKKQIPKEDTFKVVWKLKICNIPVSGTEEWETLNLIPIYMWNRLIIR
jgi:hypothetical protein